MNFADAIRQARHESGDSLLPSAAVKSTTAVSPTESQPTSNAAATDPVTVAHVGGVTTESLTQSAGTVVRLELFLTPEQLSGVFRAALATQHSVLTLREASHHVRVSSHVLEELAREGEIPAFLVDGKWRFPRNGLDEWLNLRATRKEAV